jgi:hypothetical protein
MRHHGEKYDKYIKYNGKWSKFDCGVGSSTFKFVDLAAFYVHLFLLNFTYTPSQILKYCRFASTKGKWSSWQTPTLWSWI